MKTTKLFSAVLVCVLISSYAKSQIKVVPAGSVAIGGDFTPLSKLHVYGDALFTNWTTGSYPFFGALIRGGSGDYSTGSTPDYTWHDDDQTGIIHPEAWAVGFANGGTETMRLHWNGDMTIGANLSDYNDKVRIDMAYGDERINYASLATNNPSSSKYTYAHKFFVHDATTKCVAVLLDEVDKFFVYGSGSVQSAVGYYTFSDASLKKNVETISTPLDKVLKLRGVTYKFKDETPGTYMGVIAQEVEKIVPEVVMTNEKGIKSVAYQNLVGLLIEGMKEQNTKINSLETQLAYCCTNKQETVSNLTDLRNSGGSHSPQNENTPALFQNNPNPFNNLTNIQYFLPTETKKAELLIFDLQGKLIRTMVLANRGNSSLTINANELRPGMYIYSLIVDGKEFDSKRMILTEEKN